MLPFALHGYRTTTRTSTGITPYSLVYGMEAVLPIEVQIPSLRIMKDAGLSEDDQIQTRLDQLNLIDEKRLTAVFHGQTYNDQGFQQESHAPGISSRGYGNQAHHLATK